MPKASPAVVAPRNPAGAVTGIVIPQLPARDGGGGEPAVAVIPVAPTDMPVAIPLVFTVATPFAVLDHVNATLDCGFPLASIAVAVNCWVPFIMTEAADGETTMFASRDEEEPEPHPAAMVISTMNSPVLIGHQPRNARVFIK